MATAKYIRITEHGYPTANVVETGKSHANDPYVLKKLAKVKEMLIRTKLPDYLRK